MLFWLRLSFLQSCLTFWDSKFTSCPTRTTLGTTAFFLCNYCSAVFETRRIKWALECLMSITPSNEYIPPVILLGIFYLLSPFWKMFFCHIPHPSITQQNEMVSWSSLFSLGPHSPNLYKSFLFFLTLIRKYSFCEKFHISRK